MEYILDVAKWRCGSEGEKRLGIGQTRMLNEEGFMCCLGQFSKQMGVSDSYLLDKGEPSDVTAALRKSKRKAYYDPLFVESYAGEIGNTTLANNLMNINDEESTTPADKIKSIRVELKKHGHTLKVINN